MPKKEFLKEDKEFLKKGLKFRKEFIPSFDEENSIGKFNIADPNKHHQLFKPKLSEGSTNICQGRGTTEV